jgi:uncharacterized membrane protein
MTTRPMLNGMILGAGLMYLLDPDRGRRRRSLIRDRFGHGVRDLGDGLDTSMRDLKHRSYGVLAETRSKFRSGSADDHIIEARVRSRLGRIVSHPGSIHVRSEQGTVTLDGPVLATELDGLLSTVRSVPGVRNVDNRLEVHRSASDVPGLQGSGNRPAELPDVMQENWAPATRLLVSAAGAIITLYGLRQRGVFGTASTLLGAGMVTRALTNMETARLLGTNGSRRVIDIHKSINLNAPIETVFEFWSHFENFPRFMDHLTEVRRIDDRHSHWIAQGPAGMSFAWDAEVTQWVPNELIAWKSVEGSPIGNAGVVRFLPNEKGGTRVDIRMTYNPPAGAIGHALASFFGTDPKHAMDDDLVRLKSLIEEGKTSAHGRDIRREEVGTASAAPDSAPLSNPPRRF